MQSSSLQPLDLLEAESIHILREVAAEFARPVHAVFHRQGFLRDGAPGAEGLHPAPIPFPLLHIDTTYKFREMIEFRDRIAPRSEPPADRPHQPPGHREGANPFRLGTSECCGLLKTRALLDAWQAAAFDAAFGGARREEEKSPRQRASLFIPRRLRPMGPAKTSARSFGTSTTAASNQGRIHPRLPAFQLDRTRRLAVHPARKHPDRASLFRQAPRPWSCAVGMLIPIEHDPRCCPGEAPEMVMCRMRSLGCTPCTGADPLRRRHDRKNHRRDGTGPPIRTRKTRDRSRSGRLHGNQETRGLFLS